MSYQERGQVLQPAICVDGTARAYFQGLLKLTVLDTACLALGLWTIGIHGALALGLMAAVLAWVPYVGSGRRTRDVGRSHSRNAR